MELAKLKLKLEYALRFVIILMYKVLYTFIIILRTFNFLLKFFQKKLKIVSFIITSIFTSIFTNPKILEEIVYTIKITRILIGIVLTSKLIGNCTRNAIITFKKKGFSFLFLCNILSIILALMAVFFQLGNIEVIRDIFLSDIATEYTLNAISIALIFRELADCLEEKS